jgi:hypothetical protein
VEAAAPSQLAAAAAAAGAEQVPTAAAAAAAAAGEQEASKAAAGAAADSSNMLPDGIESAAAVAVADGAAYDTSVGGRITAAAVAEAEAEATEGAGEAGFSSAELPAVSTPRQPGAVDAPGLEGPTEQVSSRAAAEATTAAAAVYGIVSDTAAAASAQLAAAADNSQVLAEELQADIPGSGLPCVAGVVDVNEAAVQEAVAVQYAAAEQDEKLDRVTFVSAMTDAAADTAAAAAVAPADQAPAGSMPDHLEAEPQQQQQQQQQGKQQHGGRVLGQHARQVILADLAGWFAEGQEQQRQQQLEALAAAVRLQQQLSGSSGALAAAAAVRLQQQHVGSSRKRGRGELDAAAAVVDLAQDDGDARSMMVLDGAGEPGVPQMHQQQQPVSDEGVCNEAALGVDAAAAFGDSFAAPASKRAKLAAEEAGVSVWEGTGLAGCGALHVNAAAKMPAPAVLPGFLLALQYLGVKAA